MGIAIVSSSTSIFQTFSNFMDEKENMEQGLKRFLDDLILENAVLKSDHFSLFACDLDHADKKLFLSYLVDIDTYADLTANLYRELEAIKEYEPEMQQCIDDRIDQFYFEYMEDRKNQYDEDYDQCEITLLT